MFRKFPTIILLLVKVRTFLHYLYTFQVQPCPYGSKYSDKWTWLAIYINL